MVISFSKVCYIDVFWSLHHIHMNQKRLFKNEYVDFILFNNILNLSLAHIPFLPADLYVYKIRQSHLSSGINSG